MPESSGAAQLRGDDVPFVESVVSSNREIVEREISKRSKVGKRKSDPDEVKRIPVTQEYMAIVVSGRYSTGHESEACFVDALYESIAAMVYSLAKKYVITCRDEVGDLVNECALRIFQKIEQFDPRKGAFTTWCWRVCSSVLNRVYRRDKRYSNRFSEYERIETFLSDESDREAKAIDGDMADAVMELFQRYPEKKNILSEMFGDPVGGLYMPDRICLTHVARDLGVEYNLVYSFFHRKVKPFFREKFGLIAGERHA